MTPKDLKLIVACRQRIGRHFVKQQAAVTQLDAANQSLVEEYRTLDNLLAGPSNGDAARSGNGDAARPTTTTQRATAGAR